MNPLTRESTQVGAYIKQLEGRAIINYIMREITGTADVKITNTLQIPCRLYIKHIHGSSCIQNGQARTHLADKIEQIDQLNLDIESDP